MSVGHDLCLLADVGRLRAGCRSAARRQPTSPTRNNVRRRQPTPREWPMPHVGYRLAAVPDLPRTAPGPRVGCRSAARRQPTFPTRNNVRRRQPKTTERPAPDVGYRLAAVPDLPRTARGPRIRCRSAARRQPTGPIAEAPHRRVPPRGGSRPTPNRPRSPNRRRSAARRQPTTSARRPHRRAPAREGCGRYAVPSGWPRAAAVAASTGWPCGSVGCRGSEPAVRGLPVTSNASAAAPAPHPIAS